MELGSETTTEPVHAPRHWLPRFTGAALAVGQSEARRNSTLALLDQAVVSGTRFLTTVLVGRYAGQDALGVYMLGFTVLMFATCIQDALITVPYTVFSPRLRPRRRAVYAGGVLLHHGWLSVLTVAVLLAAGGSLWALARSHPLAPVLLVLAAAIPFLLLREFGRRMALAHLEMGEVLRLDITMAVLQVATLGWLVYGGGLTAAYAHLAVGVGAAVGGVHWLWQARRRFRLHGGLLPVRSRLWRLAWQRNWDFARWVFAGEVLAVAHSYIAYWLLALLLGTAATGAFSACMTTVMLVNPFLLGVSNLLMPMTARAAAAGGRPAVIRVVQRFALLMCGVLAIYALVLIFFGDDVLQLFYGQQYAGYGRVVAVLGAGTLTWALNAAATCGLRAIERPDANFRATAIGLTVTMVLATSFTLKWGLDGAAIGLLLGNISTAATLMFSFYWLARQPEGKP